MTNPNHQIARDFFKAISAGNIPDDMLTDDVTNWSTNSGAQSDKARYIGGIKLFASLFDGGITYEIDSLTAEDDRVAVEARSHGKLVTGEDFGNSYMFLLRIRDGRIASIAEHFNPAPVQEKLMPLLAPILARMAAERPS